MPHFRNYCALAGKEKLIRTGHPWVFSGAVQALDSQVLPAGGLASLARIQTAQGDFLAWAQENSQSKIRLRLCTLRPEAVPDTAWLIKQLQQAFSARAQIKQHSNAYRLVFAEADGLPGLIVDRLGDYLLVQLETSGADLWLPELQKALITVTQDTLPEIKGIMELSNSDGRQLEGLAPRQGLWWGQAAPETFQIQESQARYWVRFGSQKTGFYTDQRPNRALVASYAQGLTVLDVCSYTGGFAVQAALAGARSLDLLDASAEALDLAKQNLTLNNISQDKIQYHQGDAWQLLRAFRKAKRQFDLVILDPPKLAPKRQDRDKALQAYKDLNLQGLALLPVGGYLASFSCSGLISPADLQLSLAWAAKDLGQQFQIVAQLHQGEDHPIPLHFPESAYLKGFLLRRLN